MQPKNSTTQLELFNESALPEAVTLHADRPGFFSLLVKPVALTPRQTSYRVDVLPQVLGRARSGHRLVHVPGDVLPSESPPGQSLARATVLRGSGRLSLRVCVKGPRGDVPGRPAIHDRHRDSPGVGGGPLGPGPVPEMAVEVPGAPGGTPAVECRAARARLPAGRLRVRPESKGRFQGVASGHNLQHETTRP